MEAERRSSTDSDGRAAASAVAAPRATAIRQETFFRIGAVLAIVGPVLGLLGNILHPPPSGLGEGAEGLLAGAAASGPWVPIHLIAILGAMLGTGGLLVLSRSITDEPGASFAYLAAASALLAQLLFTTFMVVDGHAVKPIGDAYAAAAPGDRAQVLATGEAVFRISIALGFAWQAQFVGITFLLYGLAVVFSDDYPTWLGWVTVLVGVGGLLAVTGQLTFLQLSLTFTILRILIAVGLVWTMVMGVLLWRRARVPAAMAPSPLAYG